MLTLLLAHQGEPWAPHDLWAEWNADPLILAGLVLAGWSYRRGVDRRPRVSDRRRQRCFWAGLLVVAVALLSPLDPLSGQLASAHMVQHVLLVVVAAPLLALSAPVATLVSGSPRAVRLAVARARRRLRALLQAVEALRGPVVAWAAHAGTLWFWHAAEPYDAAVANPLLHAAEHATFLGTGVLFWSVLVPARRPALRASYGFGALLVFTTALHTVFLSLLLTFATQPWYDAYRDTTAAWGLEPLADQQLAGAIMWVPAGLVYVGVGIALVTAWHRDVDRQLAGDAREDDWAGARAPDVPLSRSR